MLGTSWRSRDFSLYGKNIYIDIDTFPSIDYFPTDTVSQIQILICQMNWSVVLLNKYSGMKIRLWSVFHTHIQNPKKKTQTKQQQQKNTTKPPNQ